MLSLPALRSTNHCGLSRLRSAAGGVVAMVAVVVGVGGAGGCRETCTSLNDCPAGQLCGADGFCFVLGGAGEGEGEAGGGEGEGEGVGGEGEGEGAGEGEGEGGPACGNGVLEAGEVCDDGDVSSGDGCRQDCQKIEVCGDGELDPGPFGSGEECDDGNTEDFDGCSAACETERCGDGVVHANLGEECDDGNPLDNDGCSTLCIVERCGDGAVQFGESCDDGNLLGDDGCSPDCDTERCGDGTVQPSLVVPGSGGLVEQCDDNNRNPGDGCDSNCQDEICGDGERDFDPASGAGEECDDGNLVDGDGCSAACDAEVCGDGAVQPALGELCDDGALANGDGCSDTCQDGAAALFLGEDAACAVTPNGRARCWGRGYLGYGGIGGIGDDETPASAGDLPLFDIDQIAVAFFHMCAIYGDAGDGAGGAVRCWGDGFDGALGYGNTNPIDGPTEPFIGDVDVGGGVVQLDGIGDHTCAVLAGGAGVRCWGENFFGVLGLGHSEDIGDNEVPASVPPVDVGAPGDVVEQVATGDFGVCVLLAPGGRVRCWGDRPFHGHPEILENIGDDELPVSAGDVVVGAAVARLEAGDDTVCALTTTGTLRCWGSNAQGQAGYAFGDVGGSVGDDETPAEAGDVDFGVAGAVVLDVAVADTHTCVLLDLGGGAAPVVRCWGSNFSGQLGYGNTAAINLPSLAGDVDVGGVVVDVSAGDSHTCAILDNGHVRCWGDNFVGQLGYGNEEPIGDSELPSSAGDVPFL